MNFATLFYIFGIVFFLLFSILMLLLFYVFLTSYFAIRRKINELKDTKFFFSAFQRLLSSPGRAILPLIGFFTALFIKLKRQKDGDKA